MAQDADDVSEGVSMSDPVLILYLEDNPRDVELVRDKLEQASIVCELRVANDRAEYKAALTQTRFDLILSDYNLPDFDGMAALTLARAQQLDVPFILISGMLGEEQAVDCVLLGATDYVLKQRLERLVPAVLRALAEGKERQKRREAEEELQFRNVLLSTQQEASIDGILVVDGDGRIISSNRRFAEMWGIPSDVVESGSDESALQSVMDKLEDPEEFRSKVKYLYEARNETSRDEIALKDSTVFDRYSAPMFGPNERYYGRVWYFRDITELKRTEEALRHERDFEAKIIDTSPIGIVAHDRQGEITFANAEAERVLGLTRDGARHGYNAPDWRITDYEGQPFPDEKLPFRQVMATGQPVYDVRYAIENASGERVYLSINAAPSLGENGEPDGMIASINDVSKLTRADATRKLLEAELLQSQKMEAVGKLATGVAHNFNNLLTAITGYGDLLLARLPADSDLRPDVEEIARAGERAAEVTRGLLRFSRRGREHVERLDLNVVIADMETLLRQVIRADIEIATVLADKLDRVQNNQSLIEQVIVNLIVNSSDAMPGGGKLTIETANLHLAEPRLVRDLSLPAGNFVTLTVRDSGTGMDEETQARIFEPFYTTKDSDRGTGLGLSTVCGIIEDSEGAISVESAPGQGSTFTIFLPSIPDQRSRP